MSASSALKPIGIALCSAAFSMWLYKQYRWRRLDCDYETSNCRLQAEYFRNRVIWITGASSGIGEALTEYLASLNVGVKLIITARRDQLLEQMKNKLTRKYRWMKDEHIYVLPMDLNINSPDYLAAKYQTILQHFDLQSIDILLNNAGFSMRSYLTDFAEQDAIDMMQTNLSTPILLSKLVLTDIIKDPTKKTKGDGNDSKFGHIVNISSIAGRLYSPTRSVYVATKSGLIGFTYAMSQEVKEYGNVHFSVILPGPVQTDVDIAARGKHGRGHQKRDDVIQNGQTPWRCAEIICTAVSNRVLESWSVRQPLLDVVYDRFHGKYDTASALADKLKRNAGYLPPSKL